LVAANHARFRPILMTTIAMVIGMIPIAMAQGDGADMNRGLAIVIIGGLLSSLFLTLIIVPVVYSLVESFIRLWKKLMKYLFNINSKETNYTELMTADYEENENFVDEFVVDNNENDKE